MPTFKILTKFSINLARERELARSTKFSMAETIMETMGRDMGRDRCRSENSYLTKFSIRIPVSGRYYLPGTVLSTVPTRRYASLEAAT